MPLNAPPARVKGDGGEVSDYNMLRQAVIDTEARLVAAEARLTALEGRPYVYVQAAAPAGLTGAGWLDMP